MNHTPMVETETLTPSGEQMALSCTLEGARAMPKLASFRGIGLRGPWGCSCGA